VPGKPWSTEETATLAGLCNTAGSWPAIAAALGRTPASVSQKAKECGYTLRWVNAGVTPPPQPPDPAPLPHDPVEAERIRRDRVRDLREEREALTAVAGERSLRAMVESLFREIVPACSPPPKYTAPKANARNVRETALFHWSDWHYGEVVEEQRVRGFNSYDQEAATQRVRSMVTNARGILSRLRRGGYEFPRAVIAANGDLVTGSIHELEKHSNGKTIVESVVECGNLLAEAIRDVAADFERVDVFCTVGNHGRLPDARRMEQKSPLRNWDALVYFFAQCALRDVANVTVTIPDSYSVGYQIGEHRVLQQHGHEIKGWAGIPFYGIERYVSRITAMEARRNSAPDTYLVGHFHTATSLPHATGETFINGSLIGATEYSVNALGKADRPTQWLLGVHPEHGISHRWPVYPARVVRAA
jgi:hypothetical protein